PEPLPSAALPMWTEPVSVIVSDVDPEPRPEPVPRKSDRAMQLEPTQLAAMPLRHPSNEAARPKRSRRTLAAVAAGTVALGLVLAIAFGRGSLNASTAATVSPPIVTLEQPVTTLAAS